ncbi:Os07g0519100, partial [Oryza sativa Japonica Group]
PTEQEEIARYKGPDEPLTWDDVSRMKYTWKVAMETLQTVPPIFGSLRTAIKDIEYQGYHIPKGWQVSFLFFCELIPFCDIE